jgi:hypothetical protein
MKNLPPKSEITMKYDQSKPFRFRRYFHGITNHSGLWWLSQSKIWVEDLPSPLTEMASTHAPCKTLRAFRRHLRNHPELKGKAILVSKYAGYDVYA